jgi:hypothetical protein
VRAYPDREAADMIDYMTTVIAQDYGLTADVCVMADDVWLTAMAAAS